LVFSVFSNTSKSERNVLGEKFTTTDSHEHAKCTNKMFFINGQNDLTTHQLLNDAEFGQPSFAFFPHQSPVSYYQVTPQTPTNYECYASSWPHQ